MRDERPHIGYKLGSLRFSRLYLNEPKRFDDFVRIFRCQAGNHLFVANAVLEGVDPILNFRWLGGTAQVLLIIRSYQIRFAFFTGRDAIGGETAG